MEVISRLGHPNLMTYKDAFADRDNFIMVLEYLEGQSDQYQTSISPKRCDRRTSHSSLWFG